MLKKLSLFLVAVFMITMLPLHTFAAGHDPYIGMKGSDYDFASIELSKEGDVAHSLGYRDGAYMVFERVNFGDVGAFRADVKISAHLDTPVYMGGTLELRLNSIGGEVIASFKTDTTQPKLHSFVLKERLTGVHDLYLVSKNKAMKINNILFQTYAQGAEQYASYTEPDYLKDIQSSGKKDIIYTLIELGLIQPFMPDEYNPSIGVPRGYYAQTIAKILGMTDENGRETSFVDVEPSSKYSAAIAFLQESQVIFGTGGGRFNPDLYITATDAIAMAVRALGYEAAVKSSGLDYPYGYMNMASSIGLAKGISTQGYLTRNDFATLVSSILNVDYLEVTGVYGDAQSFAKNKGILSKTKDIYVNTGFVRANSFTNLVVPVGTVGDSKVLIDSETYNIGGTYGGALIGYPVKFYYKLSEDEKTLISIAPDRNVEVTTVDTSIGDIVNELSEGQLKFYDRDENRNVTIDMSPDTHILYNGKAIDDTLSNLLEQGEFKGRIRFVEGGSEATLLIEEYKTVWAKSIQPNQYRVFDGLTNASISLDPDEEDVAIFNGGKGVLFSTIADNSILSIYESKNKTGKKLIRAEVSADTAYGTITSTDDEYIYINEVPYVKAMQASQPYYPGISGTFLLNKQGEAAAYIQDIVDSDYKMGILINFDSGKGVDNAAVIQIFDENNEAIGLSCARGIVIDGIRLRNPGDVIDGSSAFDGLKSMAVKNTLIRYRTNEQNEISAIDTYKTGNNGPEDILTRLTEPNANFQYSGTGQLFVYASGYRAIAPYHTIPHLFGFKRANMADSLFFSTNLGDYMSSSAQVVESTMTGELYCLDKEQPYVTHVIWHGAGESSNFGISFVVASKSSIIVEDEEAISITGYRNSGPCNYYVKTQDYNSDSNPNMANVRKILDYIKPGDVIKVVASRDGEITNCELNFLANGAAVSLGGINVLTNKENGLGQVEYASRYRASVFGEVKDIYDDVLRVEYAPEQYEFMRKGVKCMRFSYRQGNPKIESDVPSEEISIGDKILYISQNYATQILCIYEHPELD